MSRALWSAPFTWTGLLACGRHESQLVPEVDISSKTCCLLESLCHQFVAQTTNMGISFLSCILALSRLSKSTSWAFVILPLLTARVASHTHTTTVTRSWFSPGLLPSSRIPTFLPRMSSNVQMRVRHSQFNILQLPRITLKKKSNSLVRPPRVLIGSLGSFILTSSRNKTLFHASKPDHPHPSARRLTMSCSSDCLFSCFLPPQGCGMLKDKGSALFTTGSLALCFAHCGHPTNV